MGRIFGPAWSSEFRGVSHAGPNGGAAQRPVRVHGLAYRGCTCGSRWCVTRNLMTIAIPACIDTLLGCLGLPGLLAFGVRLLGWASFWCTEIKESSYFPFK